MSRRLAAIHLTVGVVLLVVAFGVLAWVLAGWGAPVGPVPPTTTVCHTGRCS